MNHSAKNRKPWLAWIWILLFLFVSLAICYRILLVGLEPKIFANQNEMMFDDLGFALLDDEWLDGLKDEQNQTLHPAGRFLVLTTRISNHTDLVQFNIGPDQILVVSDSGDRFRVSQQAQSFIDDFGNEASTIAGGDSCERKFVFDIQGDADKLRLRVILGGRVGEMVDWFLLGDRFFPIKPPELSPDQK